MFPFKKIFVRFFLCLIVAWLSFVHLRAQIQHPLTEYTTDNGLALNSVNDLHFDQQGFLWVTTADGLQRFDGYRFQTFRHDPSDKKSIPENSVSEVYEDANNNLWITYRTGICVKPKGKNEFIDLAPHLPATSYKFPMTCIKETDTSIWIINYPAGIYAINKNSLQVKRVSGFPGFSESDIITYISRLRSKEDKVWFRKKNNLSGDIYLVTDDGLKQYKNTKRTNLLFLFPDQKDSLLIITDKMFYKALIADPFTPVRILNTSIQATDLDFERLNYPRRISQDQYLLFGINNILLYNAAKGELSVFPHHKYFSHDLVRHLSTTTFDKHGNIWLGFNGIGGIKVISVQKFNLFNRPVKNALPYSITANSNGNVFIGIYYGDIEVYDRNGEYLKKITIPEAHKKYGSPRAMAMMDSTTLIVRSTLNEVYSIDTRNGSLQILSHLLPPRTDSVFRDFEVDMHKISDHEMWMSYANSILSLKKENNKFTCTKVVTLPTKEHLVCFLYDKAGQLWTGTVNGIWLFETLKAVPQKLQIPVTYCKHLNQHPDGRIWAATTNGILIIEKNKVIKHLSMKDGLPNSFVYSVLFDDNGNSWVSTNRGITRIVSPTAADTSYQMVSYSGKEGLQGDEFNTRGYYKATDGTLYFAGVNGVNFFKPQELVNKSGVSSTMLTQIEVNNQPYKPQLQPEFISTANLPFKQNNIRLSFSCMDFTVPEKNQYKFLLKGFQNEWSLPQTNPTVQYILPVGDYELHVLGANYEGVWSKEPLILRISILPPWYQTNWAKAIFAFLILAFVAAIFYFISRSRYQKKLRALQMEQEVQKEKQRLSRDLHDNLGSQITWLSNNISQIERAEQDQQPVEKRLTQLKEGTGELMQTLRETIWILNKDKISCIELFDKVVSFAARHIESCPPLQLNTEESIASNIELNSGQALQIFRICQEAINNACKHSQATMLNIKANSANDHFSISVSDNGTGFDYGNNGIEGHYGLQNMKERAKESDLDLQIQSVPGTGTSIKISV